MKLNYTQIASLIEALTALKEEKMPFKLSLIIAKNLEALNKEQEFYIDREREFAFKYLEFDVEKQEFIQTQPGVFKIKEGLEAECQEARHELDAFEIDVNLRMIPVALIENMDFTPDDLLKLATIIDDEEE